MILKEFLETYNLEIGEEKQQFVHAKQHTLIHGKAGSGKTFLLLARIGYLIKHEKASSEEMLNLVYDGEAAKKMAQDFRTTFRDFEDMPSFIDFHSFCYRIIRYHDKQYSRTSRRAYRNMESAIRKLVKDMFALDLSNHDVRALMRKISHCKNMMLSENEITKIEIANIKFSELYKAYENFKAARNIYDQDDILVETAHILMNKPDILQIFQSRYTYIHVDDAQELSFVSHMILKMLVSDETILFVTADRDQCVDMDHCAYLDALYSFKETYEHAHIYELKENYRNNKTIVQMANTFMFQHNTEEALYTKNMEECDIKFKGFSELYKLYEYALRKAIEDEGEIAFVYRDFAMAIPLIDTLRSHQIPFQLQGSVKKFLQNSIIQDLCYFIELFIDPKDMRAFYEVYPKMGLDISNKVLLEVSDRLHADDSVDIYQALMESSYKAAGKKKLASNMENIRMVSMKNTLGMVDFIFDIFKYREQVLQQLGIAMNDANILAFKVLADRYCDPMEFLSKLKVLSECQCDESSSHINIRSIQACRGLEYDRVCLLDCMASTFPARSCDEDELQEERRLFYMGITRAKHQLEFFTAKRCFRTRLEISPFLYEVHNKNESDESQEHIGEAVHIKKLKESNIRRGMKIIHTTLGKGSILKVSDGMMQVRFAEETKTLNIKLCLKNHLVEAA